MTVEQFLGERLPNVTFGDFKKLCASVGIVITSQTDKLSKEDISRLVNDYHFNDRLANGTIITSLNQMIARLEKISSKYETLLSDPSINSDDKKGIKEANDRIKNSISKYSVELDTVKVRDSYNWKSIYESNGKNTSLASNGFEQARFNSLHTRIMKKSDKLIEFYKKIDELNSQNAKTPFKKAAVARKKASLARKVENLRKRQGVLVTRQRRVTDRNAKRYIDRMAKVNQKETKASNIEVDYNKRQHDLREAAIAYESDIIDSKKELNALSKASAKKSELIELRIEIKRMEQALNKLNKKSVKLRGAHSKELSKSASSNKLS